MLEQINKILISSYWSSEQSVTLMKASHFHTRQYNTAPFAEVGMVPTWASQVGACVLLACYAVQPSFQVNG